jgi:polyisoprenoid-binding protein YceI
MTKRLATIFFALCAVLLVEKATPSFADTTTFEFDPAHTSAQFAVKHLVVSTVRGSMGRVSGAVEFDEADPAKSTVQATIDVRGIDTNDEKRDEHLRGADFFDAAKYPTITFQSKSAERVADGKYKVTGDLTIKGVTKEVVLDVEGATKPIRDPFGNTKLGGIARTKINRQDFGISWSRTMDGGGLVVGDEVDIVIDIEVKQQSPS